MDFYFLNGLSPATRRAYQAARRRYENFCVKGGAQPLPTSESLLCMYVAQLANDHLCHATIKCYLSAIRHWHIAEGMGDPGIYRMTRLEQVLKGIKLTQAKTASQANQTPPGLPFTPALLSKLREIWQGSKKEWNNSMLWASASLCFFGFFRSGEITVADERAFDKGAQLTFDDIKVDCLQSPKHLKIRLKASKTDQRREGTDVFIGRTHNQLCPVAAVLAYMVKRGKGLGPFFRWQDGKPLTRARFVMEVKCALTNAGVDARRYSGHSFRSGAATMAARQGVGDATIKLLG